MTFEEANPYTEAGPVKSSTGSISRPYEQDEFYSILIAGRTRLHELLDSEDGKALRAWLNDSPR